MRAHCGAGNLLEFELGPESGCEHASYPVRPLAPVPCSGHVRSLKSMNLIDRPLVEMPDRIRRPLAKNRAAGASPPSEPPPYMSALIASAESLALWGRMVWYRSSARTRLRPHICSVITCRARVCVVCECV